MRAAVIQRLGDPPLVEERDEPEPAPGFALIEVAAAALNPLDLAIAAGRHYGGSPSTPYVPGSEGAGTVIRSDSFQPGTRVRFESRATQGGSGSLAERALVPDDALLELPPEADDAVAASLGIAGLAAWLALEWRAKLEKGEVVLVLGASGAVGQIAVQAAKLLGAGRVIAAGRDDAALSRATELGADAAVRLRGRSVEALTEDFRAAAEGDIDVVIDPLWGEPAIAAFDALGPGGRLVNLGQSAGADASFSSAAVRGRRRSILGHANAMTPADIKRDAFRALLEHAIAGRLRVDLEVLPLEEVARAWELQASSPHRKIVLTPVSPR